MISLFIAGPQSAPVQYPATPPPPLQPPFNARWCDSARLVHWLSTVQPPRAKSSILNPLAHPILLPPLSKTAYTHLSTCVCSYPLASMAYMCCEKKKKKKGEGLHHILQPLKFLSVFIAVLASRNVPFHSSTLWPLITASPMTPWLRPRSTNTPLRLLRFNGTFHLPPPHLFTGAHTHYRHKYVIEHSAGGHAG